MQFLESVLGWSADVESLTLGQTAVRAFVVFCAGIALVRVGNKRFMGKTSPLDVLVAVMLGTILARAINGNARLGPTLAGAATLVGVHHVFSALALKWPWFDFWVKGRPRMLIRDGKLLEPELRKSHLNLQDMEEILRLHGDKPDPREVEEAYLERSGAVSVLKKERS